MSLMSKLGVVACTLLLFACAADPVPIDGAQAASGGVDVPVMSGVSSPAGWGPAHNADFVVLHENSMAIWKIALPVRAGDVVTSWALDWEDDDSAYDFVAELVFTPEGRAPQPLDLAVIPFSGGRQITTRDVDVEVVSGATYEVWLEASCSTGCTWVGHTHAPIADGTLEGFHLSYVAR